MSRANNLNHGVVSGSSAGKTLVDAELQRLEELPPGRKVATRDGSRFIRTNRICMCFCNLQTGCLCSAKDVYHDFGGLVVRPCRDGRS